MAKLKAQIVTDINNLFVTNGNITAVETSTTLKDILDCTELNDKGDLVGIENRLTTVENTNVTQNLRLDFLEQNNGNNQNLFSTEITYQDSLVDTFFSFRGIQNHFVNITFRIRVIENFQGGSILFSNGQLPQLKSMLEGIIDYQTNQMLNFTVTITNAQGGTDYFRIGNVRFYFIDDSMLGVRILNYQGEPSGMQNGDEIYTSIALHSSYNDITGKISKNLKNGAKGFEDLIPPTQDPKNNLKDTVALPLKDKLVVTKLAENAKPTSTTTKAIEVKKAVTASSTKSTPKKAASTTKTPVKKQIKTVTKPKVENQKPTKPIRKK